ncbi:hypothetical protein MMC26_006920 [Xylographa opegraphella]|nr:hypothetical protein [Xylographa opegraphella]
MGLVEDFPTDPFVPSLRHAATCQVPIIVPWGREPIKLGTSLLVSRGGDVESKFLDSSKSAFSLSSLLQTRLVFTSVFKGDVAVAETANTASASQGRSEDRSLALREERNTRKALLVTTAPQQRAKCSYRNTYRNGKVTFLQEPRLSADAVSLLHSPKNGQDALKAFANVYGEYYVAAYVLGGSNATMMGGMAASESSSTDLSGSYTVRFAFIEKSKSIENHERTRSAIGEASLAAYDTLTNWESNAATAELASYSDIMHSAAENRDRGWSLGRRVVAETGTLGLDGAGRRSVSWEECEMVCRAGMVVELLLLPYAGLRHYIEAFYSAE